MGTISVTLPADGDTIDASDVNNPLNTIVTAVNGNLDSNNISAGGVATSNLATGIQSSTKEQVPYKFNVYRNAAWTSGNSAFALVTFDTKVFDTGTNYDTSTGKFTAPIAGFYQFNWMISFGISASSVGQSALYVNGTQIVQGSGDQVGTGGFSIFTGGSALLQLAATDYVQIYSYGSGAAGTTGKATQASGFLVSAT